MPDVVRGIIIDLGSFYVVVFSGCRFSLLAYVYYGPLSSDKTASELWCLSEGKRVDYQNCSVLYCIRQLCTIISTIIIFIL